MISILLFQVILLWQQAQRPTKPANEAIKNSSEQCRQLWRDGFPPFPPGNGLHWEFTKDKDGHCWYSGRPDKVVLSSVWVCYTDGNPVVELNDSEWDIDWEIAKHSGWHRCSDKERMQWSEIAFDVPPIEKVQY